MNSNHAISRWRWWAAAIVCIVTVLIMSFPLGFLSFGIILTILLAFPTLDGNVTGTAAFGLFLVGLGVAYWFLSGVIVDRLIGTRSRSTTILRIGCGLVILPIFLYAASLNLSDW